MERKHSPKGIILDINSMRSRAKKLLKNDSEYNTLLEAIIEKDYYNDDSLAIPTLKAVAQKAGINYSVARRLLDKIYSDLCSYALLDKFPFEINKTRVLFGLNGMYKNASMLLNGLQIIPRKGEIVQIPYFKELTGSSFFHVSKIYHEFNDDQHEVFISLDDGSYNSYWDLRKDQAEETGEISKYDSNMKSNYELRQMLNLRPGKAW